MTGRRPMKTGYQLNTLRKRIDELTAEALRMGEDGRMPLRMAVIVARDLQKAVNAINELRQDAE